MAENVETGMQLTHECGHVLGTFLPEDDHGAVAVVCPKCNRKNRETRGIVVVHNGQLTQLIEDHDAGVGVDFPFTDCGVTFEPVEVWT